MTTVLDRPAIPAESAAQSAAQRAAHADPVEHVEPLPDNVVPISVARERREARVLNERARLEDLRTELVRAHDSLTGAQRRVCRRLAWVNQALADCDAAPRRP